MMDVVPSGKLPAGSGRLVSVALGLLNEPPWRGLVRRCIIASLWLCALQVQSSAQVFLCSSSGGERQEVARFPCGVDSRASFVLPGSEWFGLDVDAIELRWVVPGTRVVVHFASPSGVAEKVELVARKAVRSHVLDRDGYASPSDVLERLSGPMSWPAGVISGVDVFGGPSGKERGPSMIAASLCNARLFTGGRGLFSPADEVGVGWSVGFPTIDALEGGGVLLRVAVSGPSKDDGLLRLEYSCGIGSSGSCKSLRLACWRGDLQCDFDLEDVEDWEGSFRVGRDARAGWNEALFAVALRARRGCDEGEGDLMGGDSRLVLRTVSVVQPMIQLAVTGLVGWRPLSEQSTALDCEYVVGPSGGVRVRGMGVLTDLSVSRVQLGRIPSWRRSEVVSVVLDSPLVGGRAVMEVGVDGLVFLSGEGGRRLVSGDGEIEFDVVVGGSSR